MVGRARSCGLPGGEGLARGSHTVDGRAGAGRFLWRCQCGRDGSGKHVRRIMDHAGSTVKTAQVK
jgi:hypothetical protein